MEQDFNVHKWFTKQHLSEDLGEDGDVNERTVYKGAEFEEIDNAISTIRDNMFIFRDEAIINEIEHALEVLQQHTDANSTEDI